MIHFMLILIKLFCVLCMRHCHCGREHSYQDRNVSSLSTDPSLLDDQWTQTVPEKLPLPFCCVHVGELRLRGSSDFQLAIEHIIRMPRDPALSCNWSEGQTSLTPAHFVLIPSLPPPPVWPGADLPPSSPSAWSSSAQHLFWFQRLQLGWHNHLDYFWR